MWFLGDVHGEFKTYNWVLNKMMLPKDRPYPELSVDLTAELQQTVEEVSGVQSKGLDCSLQLGDMGVSWDEDVEALQNISMQHRFIRGNHDNPELCRTIPNFIGDWGYDEHTDIFWVGGGFSIDAAVRQRDMKLKRVKGPIWWPDEEIAKKEHKKIREVYAKAEPRILVSHEGPPAVKSVVLPWEHAKHRINSDTEGLLYDLWCMYPPDLWICGHYHRKAEWNAGKTDFVVLNEMKFGPLKQTMFEVPGLKWAGSVSKDDKNVISCG
jgi:hypothetical protein